jgi:hypothetical protein
MFRLSVLPPKFDFANFFVRNSTATPLLPRLKADENDPGLSLSLSSIVPSRVA